MRDEYVIERQGKRYVLYAGLLEEAHAKGLESIETELLQIPGSENGEVAIARAVVRTEGGKFTGIGDASPQNVGRMIAPHIIRMAETRAKARALRDAINVGVASIEELGEDEGAYGAQERPRAVSDVNADKPATGKQIGALLGLAEKQGMSREQLEEEMGAKIDDLLRAEASEWIGRLSKRAA